MATGSAATTAIKLGIGAVLVVALGVSAWMVIPAKPDRPNETVPSVSVEVGPAVDRPSPSSPESQRVALEVSPQDTASAPPDDTAIPKGSVSIVITDLDRTPIAGAVVEVMTPEPLGAFHSDGEGVCPLPVKTGTGSLQLRISANGFVTENRRVTKAERQYVVLRRAATVRGRVIATHGGANVAGALVTRGRLVPNTLSFGFQPCCRYVNRTCDKG